VVTKNIKTLDHEICEAKGRVEFKDLPCVMGNETQIEQLFANLIFNSLKYRKNNTPSRIVIKHHKTSGKLLNISIKDNGIGFDNSYADKIFDPFQRLDGDISKRGSGLGLSICKKIMLAHRGDILAEGKIGNGATFILTFSIS
ncbi:MAG: PAS domain-containing sensor histidine kinase, partial [Nitrospina sp.]|nr:PAS domain-containing sensor histidine kinase [Nitrospina sp.]